MRFNRSGVEAYRVLMRFAEEAYKLCLDYVRYGDEMDEMFLDLAERNRHLIKYSSGIRRRIERMKRDILDRSRDRFEMLVLGYWWMHKYLLYKAVLTVLKYQSEVTLQQALNIADKWFIEEVSRSKGRDYAERFLMLAYEYELNKAREKNIQLHPYFIKKAKRMGVR